MQSCAAQGAQSYTDAKTGIKFSTWGVYPNASDPDSVPATEAFTFGLALPGDALEKDSNEYIGILVRDTTSAAAAQAGHY